MALESIIEITNAEENARKRVSASLQEEQRETIKLKELCEENYSQKLAEAEKKAEEILKNATEQAENSAKEYLESLATKNAVAAVHAESRYPDCIELIIGKVVNG